jgi:hypothetical protein
MQEPEGLVRRLQPVDQQSTIRDRTLSSVKPSRKGRPVLNSSGQVT